MNFLLLRLVQCVKVLHLQISLKVKVAEAALTFIYLLSLVSKHSPNQATMIKSPAISLPKKTILFIVHNFIPSTNK